MRSSVKEKNHKCRIVSFRPTRKMLDKIEEFKKEAELSDSETMRFIVGQYMMMVKLLNNKYMEMHTDYEENGE